MKHVLEYTKRMYTFSGMKLIINVLGMVLISLLEGTGILLLLPIISLSGIANVNTNISPISGMLSFLQDIPKTLGLPFILGLFILIVTGQNLLQRTLAIRDTVIQQRFYRHLRIETYSALLHSNWNFFVKKRKSDLLNLLTSELTRVGFGTTLVLQLTASIIFTFIQISFAFWLAPELTLFVLCFGLLLAILSRKFIKKSTALGSQTSHLSQSFLAGISDQLSGIKEIKSNTLEESRMMWFSSLTQKMMNEQVAYIKLRSASQLFYKIASTLLIAAFILVSVKLFYAQIEQLFLILVIFSRLWPRFTGIQSNMESIASSIPAFSTLVGLLAECKDAKEIHLGNEQDYKQIKPLEINQDIQCKAVAYRYHRNEPTYALQGINLTIPSRQTTAIVGSSGAGKSTLIDIIMGLIQPEEGIVLIDGVPLQGEMILSLRKSISYVPQDSFLFHASIKENMLMIEPDVTVEQIWEALEFSAAAEFVRKLPQQLETIIGDRGIRFSGGERQRLVLARAILRNPSILILDEATSALDTANEAGFQQALDRLRGKMTIIIIAHRLSTIRNADQVIVLDQGMIVQIGGYSLLAGDRDGLFFKLLGNQTRGVEVNTLKYSIMG